MTKKSWVVHWRACACHHLDRACCVGAAIAGSIGNALWTGVDLCHVLRKAGFNPQQDKAAAAGELECSVFPSVVQLSALQTLQKTAAWTRVLHVHAATFWSVCEAGREGGGIAEN